MRRWAYVVAALILVVVIWSACNVGTATEPDIESLSASHTVPPPAGSCSHGFSLQLVSQGLGMDRNLDCAVCRKLNLGGRVAEVDNNVGGPASEGGFCNAKP